MLISLKFCDPWMESAFLISPTVILKSSANDAALIYKRVSATKYNHDRIILPRGP